MLSDDIRYLTERALWETENLMKCIPVFIDFHRIDCAILDKYANETSYFQKRTT